MYPLLRFSSPLRLRVVVFQVGFLGQYVYMYGGFRVASVSKLGSLGILYGSWEHVNDIGTSKWKMWSQLTMNMAISWTHSENFVHKGLTQFFNSNIMCMFKIKNLSYKDVLDFHWAIQKTFMCLWIFVIKDEFKKNIFSF